MISLHDQSARVQVHFVPAPSRGVQTSEHALSRKITAVWQNNVRNDFVVKLAIAIEDSNQQRLRSFGLDELQIPRATASLTVVLVESVLHGRELRRRLRSWEFHHCSHRTPHGARPPFQLGEPRQAIVTLTAAVEDFAPDILINAMGGEWICDIPAYPLEDGIVIDFADDGDDQAAAATRARMRAYLARGWRVNAPAGGNPWNTT